MEWKDKLLTFFVYVLIFSVPLIIFTMQLYYYGDIVFTDPWYDEEYCFSQGMEYYHPHSCVYIIESSLVSGAMKKERTIIPIPER